MYIVSVEVIEISLDYGKSIQKGLLAHDDYFMYINISYEKTFLLVFIFLP